MTTNIYWNIEVNGTLYEVNAGNLPTESSSTLFMETAIMSHPFLSTILRASYDNGLIIKNQSTTPLRIRLIPDKLPTKIMTETSNNPTYNEESSGIISFCLAVNDSLEIGTNYFGINVAGTSSGGFYSLYKDSTLVLDEVTLQTLIDYFIDNEYDVTFFDLPT